MTSRPHVLPSSRGSHPTTSLKDHTYHIVEKSRVVHRSILAHPTSAMGQKHALPHRTIAVPFTPINGHQCEGRSGRCVWTPGQAS